MPAAVGLFAIALFCAFQHSRCLTHYHDEGGELKFFEIVCSELLLHDAAVLAADHAESGGQVDAT